jgi:hypothetical protein
MSSGKMSYKAEPTAGSIGKSYITHGENIGLKDLAEIARHANLSPSEARAQLIDLVNAIPDDDLTNYIAAQVTVIA